MTSKTPITILQEMMAKRQKMPTYELIVNGGGTHINTFVYQVSCDGLVATGEGRSKKDAKHEAANAMLKAIAAHRRYPQLPASPAESPVRTPLPKKVPEAPRVQPNEPFINAVGILQSLCTDNNLDSPIYRLISDIGPSHAKIFTIQCRVTTFVETGIAKTKKLAKQEAAKKMVDKLRDLIPELPTQVIEMDKEQEENCHEIAKARYTKLSRLPKKISMGLKISEYHTQFKNSFEPDVREELMSKLTNLIEDKQTLNSVSNDELVSLTNKFEEILASVNLDSMIMDITAKNDVCVVGMSVNCVPDIVQMGIGKTKSEAHFQTLIKVVKSMIMFLK